MEGRKQQAESTVLLVDEREAARLLGISPRLLWGFRKAGRVPCVRIGRAVRYYVKDLETFIEQQKQGG
jgi:predicted DNA-binding transcriptional regulator AlpA